MSTYAHQMEREYSAQNLSSRDNSGVYAFSCLSFFTFYLGRIISLCNLMIIRMVYEWVLTHLVNKFHTNLKFV